MPAPPEQYAPPPVTLYTAGVAFTFTVTLVVVEHPAAEVPVTAYIVVAVGLALTVAPVVVLNPVEGDQLKLVATDGETVLPIEACI